MLSLFVYFLIFLIPGLFSILIYNCICCHRVEGCSTVPLALIFDLLIMGINFAGLHILRGICSLSDLQCRFNCLCFTIKYIILSLAAGLVLAILACLLQRFYCFCKRHFHCCHKNCN